jgi:hypothetical protein
MEVDTLLAKIHPMMSSTTFIPTGQGEEYWRYLVNRIEELRLPEDNFNLLESNCAGAWRTEYGIYERLLRRSRLPRSQEQIDTALRHKAFEEQWNLYIECRAHLERLAKQDVLTANVAEYLGLEEGDLGSPSVADSRFGDGRRPDWREVAARLSTARGKLERMTPEERLAMPMIISLRRLNAAFVELKASHRALEQRVAELECNNIEVKPAHAA